MTIDQFQRTLNFSLAVFRFVLLFPIVVNLLSASVTLTILLVNKQSYGSSLTSSKEQNTSLDRTGQRSMRTGLRLLASQVGWLLVTILLYVITYFIPRCLTNLTSK